MMTLGERLRLSIERWGGGIRGFQKEMKAHEVRGHSMPSIYSYLDDEVTPSLDFLEVAADVLRVRLEWLRTGEGKPTAAEEEIEKRVTEQIGHPIQEPWKALADAFPASRCFAPEDVATAALWDTWGNLWSTHPGEEGMDDDVAERVLGEILQHPLSVLGVDLADLRGWQARNYVVSMCQAVNMLLTRHLERDWKLSAVTEAPQRGGDDGEE